MKSFKYLMFFSLPIFILLFHYTNCAQSSQSQTSSSSHSSSTPTAEVPFGADQAECSPVQPSPHKDFRIDGAMNLVKDQNGATLPGRQIRIKLTDVPQAVFDDNDYFLSFYPGEPGTNSIQAKGSPLPITFIYRHSAQEFQSGSNRYEVSESIINDILTTFKNDYNTTIKKEDFFKFFYIKVTLGQHKFLSLSFSDEANADNPKLSHSLAPPFYSNPHYYNINSSRTLGYHPLNHLIDTYGVNEHQTFEYEMERYCQLSL